MVSIIVVVILKHGRKYLCLIIIAFIAMSEIHAGTVQVHEFHDNLYVFYKCIQHFFLWTCNYVETEHVFLFYSEK